MKKFGNTAAAEARRKEMAENRSELRDVRASAWATSKAWTHNGIIGILYVIVMFLVFYLALEVAFYGVAFLVGSTGAFAMETPADVLTIYVVVAMVCGFDMFFAFKAENVLIRALKRRIWHVSGSEIDKGDAWRKRHEKES